MTNSQPDLVLRPFELSDLPAFVELCQDEGIQKRANPGITADDCRRSLTRLIERMHADGVAILAVLAGTTDEMVGQAGLIRGWEDYIEPVVFLRASHTSRHKHKHGTNLMVHLIDRAFKLPDVPQIVSTIDENNDPAIGLAEKVGMQQIGEVEYLLPDEQAKLVYGLRRGDWESGLGQEIREQLRAANTVVHLDQRFSFKKKWL